MHSLLCTKSGNSEFSKHNNESIRDDPVPNFITPRQQPGIHDPFY
jgi:hypothetical protein